MLLDFINWHVDPEIFRIGSLAVRWYGLFFVLAFYLGYVIGERMFKKEGRSTKLLDKLFLYMFIFTLVGARLGHCFFYEPGYYLSHPLEILMIWKGGLASHGAAIAIPLGIWIFVRKHREITFFQVLDKVVIVVALAAAFIRMGNLMNSEIVGKPTDKSNAFIFQRLDQEFPDFYANWNDGKAEIIFDTINGHHMVNLYSVFRQADDDTDWQLIGSVSSDAVNAEGKLSIVDPAPVLHSTYKLAANGMPLSSIKLTPRHPSQIYEASAYFLIFLLLLFIYLRKWKDLPEGILFSLFLILIFTFRFFVEFSKDVQVDFEQGMTLNMGQWLSIPFILLGVGVLILSLYRNKRPDYSSVSDAE